MYTVKDAARITGLTEHAVRFYTDKGLVPSVQRNENNIRLFDEQSINWLYGIKCLKQSGMPIEDIKMYVDYCLEGDATIQQRCTLMMEHKEAALVKLEEAKLTLHIWNKKSLYIKPFWRTVLQTLPIPATGKPFSICIVMYFTLPPNLVRRK